LKGIYALVIRLENDAAYNIGALGMISFKKGLYIYVGSAQTNLEERVRRHLRKEKRLFWHIDYLLGSNMAKAEKVFHMKGDKAAECVVANEVGKRGEPIMGFGSSDCNCKSHLFRVENYDFLLEQMSLLKMEP
jgi:Uri superfamily endonuclease